MQAARQTTCLEVSMGRTKLGEWRAVTHTDTGLAQVAR